MDRKGISVLIGVAGLCVAATAGRMAEVRIEGALATNDVLVKDGKTYVPLADMAKALGLTVQKTATGYDLVKAGGANQLQGTSGKIGDDLFNGRYRFKVVNVSRTSAYKAQFANLGFDVTPVSPDHDIVAIVCRIKNGTKDSQMIDLFMGDNTALTDMDEHSYECFKGASVDAVARAPKLLPGAAVDFALTFEVPKSEQVKDLVYQINDFSNNRTQIYRVSLQQ